MENANYGIEFYYEIEKKNAKKWEKKGVINSES
jgi:hypothetical protein